MKVPIVERVEENSNYMRAIGEIELYDVDDFYTSLFHNGFILQPCFSLDKKGQYTLVEVSLVEHRNFYYLKKEKE